MALYDFKAIEKKWQRLWDEERTFCVTEDPQQRDKKFYVLEMFPYPSGRLHMGHVRNYTIADCVARYKRMHGLHVMHPIGWDAFGMPAENAALKLGKHPEDWTMENIRTMQQQLKKMGFSYDWSREITTCKPDYYRWNQWLFLELYKRGLVYRKQSSVNWCPTCATVLANEQAEEGTCWRCDTPVVQKDLEQWFFKITDYKDALLNDHARITHSWSERVLTMQKNWIGKSEGTMIDFPIEKSREIIRVFTTRPDTLCGVTYLVLAPEHPLVEQFARGTSQEAAVKAFVGRITNQSEMERKTKDKEGVFSGGYVCHPLRGTRIPVWIGNYVLSEYGTGAVMAVPAHDQRDFDFARTYNLPIEWVVFPADGTACDSKCAYEDPGVLKNSDTFDGLTSHDACSAITATLAAKKLGNKACHYRIKDWLISRQRYWGTPIPMIYCDTCGIVPVPQSQLPVVLPHDVTFTGCGDSPLNTVSEFVHTQCPVCGKKARRETDTMDTFVDSSWYFVRYCDPHNTQAAFDRAKTDYWMPVDHYIGGAEHACMHLLYARFFAKVFVDMGLMHANATEPFTRLLNQGMVIKDGAKMSKSKGNIVDPDEMLEKYGADALRLFILFASPPHKDLEWNEGGIEGMSRFLQRLWRITEDVLSPTTSSESRAFDREAEQWLHQTIKKVTDDFETFSYNTAIASVMEMLNMLYKKKDTCDTAQLTTCIETLVIMLNPFVPHICEELWSMLGHTTHCAPWPVYDEQKARATEVTLVVQVNGKLRARITMPEGVSQQEAEARACRDEKIAAALANTIIAKIIFVKNKLLNIVTK